VHFRRAFGALLVVAAAMLPALGQNHPTTPSRASYGIAGNVRDDSDQHALENIRVDLKGSTGTPMNSTFTRGNGEFEFDGIPSGDYFVEITVQGYEPYRESFTIYNTARRGVAVFLRRPMALENKYANVSISAHELSVPHKAHDEYEKGLTLLYSKSDYKGAITQFQRAIKDFPTFYEAYAQEGNAYVDLGEVGPAEEAIRKSIDLSSKQYSDAFFQLAGLLNNTKRFSEAETICREGLALEGSSWHGHYEMARSLSALKRFEEAEKDATEARNLKPDSPPVYLILANIHIQRRDYAALQKDLDGYLKLEPAGPEADQARKTRDQLQAVMQQERDQARTNEQNSSRSKTQDQSRPGTQDQSETDASNQPQPAERGQSQSNEQEPPLLPPLPPPEPEQ
jgi:tetratricopeptide (TPR) repeat protein